MSTYEFNKLQMEEIDKHKWIESEKAGRDLYPEAALEWITRFAKRFREEMMKRPRTYV